MSRALWIALGSLVLVVWFTFLPACRSSEERRAAAIDPSFKRIVFLAGGRSHGFGEHEFRAGCLLLAEALNEQSGLKVHAEVHGEAWMETPEMLEGADAVVFYCDASEAIGDQWEYLDGLAADGVGLVFLHYAVHPTEEMAERYQRRWIGGAMETGFSVNPHWLAELVPMAGHPISRGVRERFETLDEFYYNMRFQDEREDVLDLVTAVPTRERMRAYINLWNRHGVEGLGKPQTLMWGVERDDGGRGVGFTGGHYHRNWAVDDFRKLVLNAVVWCAGMDVPEGGVISRPVGREQLNANLDDYGTPDRILELPDLEAYRRQPPARIPQRREREGR